MYSQNQNNQGNGKTSAKNVGGIWVKRSIKGQEYLSITVEIDGKKHQLVAFPNEKGENQNRPDYTIRISEPKKQNDVPF
jgi:uncharacterized protein (DUF736 family)